MIDTTFNFFSDANGGDPDSTSPTLRAYHKILWSKPLPSGEIFDLRDDIPGYYLRYQNSESGDLSLGSDAITHSYKNQNKKKWLTTQVPEEVQDLFDRGSKIGAYIIFPNKQVDRKPTINQARGISRLIDDRFDLTLECIRRFFAGEPNPLESTLGRYSSFFELFETFKSYVEFFLLDERGNVNFYLPFDGFHSPPEFKDVEGYLVYKQRVEFFLDARNRRIEKYSNQG